MILSGEDVLWTMSAIAWTRVDSHIHKRTKRLQHPKQSESRSRQQSEWSFDRDTVILRNNLSSISYSHVEASRNTGTLQGLGWTMLGTD